MSKSATRNDTNCLNCGFPDVTDRFCPKCGQENIPSHLTFSALAYHAIEDLTHYDNAFWKTIRYLLFHPARLTKIYLSGKRKQFVPPIKLYIFISFITFFLPTILPALNTSDQEEISAIKKDVAIVDKDEKVKEGVAFMKTPKLNSVEELDRYQDSLPKDKKMGDFRYRIHRGLIINKLKDGENGEEFFEIFFHNIPKAIFLYLPVFGFFLWLFHNKKRWFFFDHAIFTFHYFSFIFLILTISITLLERILDLLPLSLYDVLSNLTGFLTVTWIFVYFYIAHKRIYQERSIVSFGKSTLLLFINLILFSVLMAGLALYTLLNLH